MPSPRSAQPAPRIDRGIWTLALTLVGAVVGLLVLVARVNRRPPETKPGAPVDPPESASEAAAPDATPSFSLRLSLWDDLILFVIVIALLFLLPRPYANGLLAVMVVAAVGLAVGLKGQSYLAGGLRRLYRWLTLVAHWLAAHPGALEIAVILLAVYAATGPIRDWIPELRIAGDELSYLLNSGIIASKVYQRSGSIPLWNPFIGSGEPLLESPFSFILNPLMTLPIFALGAVNGAKFAVLLHMAILGLGGWALAKRLALNSPGRLLLALLLLGSGSVTGLIGKGFYQMGLSLAYVPWIFAGLLGVLHDRDRRSLAVMIVAATLMVCAGTYWYVLPTAIGAALITLLALVHRDPVTGQQSLNLRGLGRLLLAAVLLLILAAVRLLPQVVHHDLIYHPLEIFDYDAFPFLRMFEQYFQPETYTHSMDEQAIFYHYILPMAFAGYLLAAKMLLRRVIPLWKRVSIVLPGLFLMMFFAVWAQGGTPFLRWLYEQFALLREWRFEPRLMAAGGFWLAVVAAIWFDDLVIFAWRHCLAVANRPSVKMAAALIAYGGLLVIMLAAGAISTLDILYNWQRTARLESLYSYDWTPLYYLRALHPNEFLMVETPGFFRYEPFYETLIRASFGNPDYHPKGLPSTIGHVSLWDGMAEYAWGGVEESSDFIYDPTDLGYQPVEGSIDQFGQRILWYNDSSLTYAFTVSPGRAAEESDALTRADITPVTTYHHHIDWIDLTARRYQPGALLAIQETAYPGWRVSVDGREVQVQSLGGRLAVYLPMRIMPVKVVFWYDPVWLYRGAAISGVGLLLFVFYTLRLDRWLRRSRRARPVTPEIAADKS